MYQARDEGLLVVPVGQLVAHTVPRTVRSIGLSPQRPLWRAYQADPDAVERWKTERYPEIKAAAAAAGGVIFFADEASVRSDYHGGTTWGEIGHTPVVSTTGARFSVNMISAVSPQGSGQSAAYRLEAAAWLGTNLNGVDGCESPSQPTSSLHVVKVREVIRILEREGWRLERLGSQVQEQNSSFLPASAPSERAAALMTPLEHKGVTPVLVVATPASGRFTSTDQQALAHIAASARTIPTVVKVFDAGLAPDGKAAELIVQSWFTVVRSRGIPESR